MTEQTPLFFPKSRWRHIFVLAVLGLAAYSSTFKVGFLWDDHIIIENNPFIRTWTWDNLKHDFTADNTQGTGDNYFRPLQAFSHRIDYSLWKLNPLGYHVSDVLVHIANAVLLYVLIQALGFTPFVGFIAACLFVVHPVGVEQFLVASGRTTPLSFFFSLSCILLLLRRNRLATIGGLSCFVLALLTKEISVVTPVLVALVFYYRKEPVNRWWVVAGMFLLIPPYLLLRHHAVHEVTGPLEPDLLALFFFKVLPRIVFHYACLILWPWNLHSHHLIPRMSHFWFISFAGLLTLLATFLWKRYRLGIFCIGWFVTWLLPTIPILMSGGFMLDHWAYPMTLGILLPLALVTAHGLSSKRSRVRSAFAAVFFSMIIGGALLVHLNVELRGTDEKIYRWALYFTTSTPIKHNLGVHLLQLGRPAEALPYLEEVKSLYPENPANIRALAIAYWECGHRQLAVRQLEDYLRRYPSNSTLQDTLNKMKARR